MGATDGGRVIGPLSDFPPEQIGGKGAGLARLLELGFPVPDVLVVPVDAVGVIDTRDIERIRGLGEPLAVRSSAVGEDAGDRSAAGQYESLMGVRPGEVADAVARVHRSAASERVRSYRGAEADGSMAVLVQREVPATRAGVVFSRDPLGDSADTVVECVFGHGEQLVSGAVTPDRYRVGPDGGVTARLAGGDGPSRLLRSLRDDEVQALADVAARAEEGFGHPADVEFCFDGRRLWVLQCRAITTPVA
jgi:phosphoenolpyruvate synthase/pyruvate phosphate dikinase